MIFAAGLGTRLKPLTDHMPKAMVSVGGEPLIRHVIEKLKASDAERIVVNVHHFAEQITDYLKDNNNFGVDIRISDESQKLLDTGGGIKKAAPLFLGDGVGGVAAVAVLFVKLVEKGELDPEAIVTPGIYVHKVVPIERVATQAGGFKKSA